MVVPDAEESTRFWSEIWDNSVKHKKNPEWLKDVEDELAGEGVQEDIRSAVDNFRPITCLPLLWKLLTGIIAEELYNYLEEAALLTWEQKGCRKGSRGTKDQLLIDKMILKNYKNEIDGLVNTVRIFSEAIKMEFGLSKCGVLIIKRGKVVESDGLRMPDGAMMRKIEESGNKYLGVLEVDGIKHDQMKDQVKKEYTRRVRNILKSKLNGGNIISAINSRAVSVVRYGAGIIKGTKNELEEMDRKTRKLMTMYGAQHPKADVDRLYLKRYDGGRGLLGVEYCVQAEVNRNNEGKVFSCPSLRCSGCNLFTKNSTQAEVNSLDKYFRASEENMLKEVNISSILENKKHEQSREDIQKSHKERYENKGLHGQFHKATEKIKSRNLRKRVYGEDMDSSCRMCGAAEETVAHIVSECQKLAQKEYKEKSDKWYTHNPEKVLESDECKILWDFPTQTDKTLEHNRPDITVIEKNNKKCLHIDPACPFDTRIERKEEEKCNNYCDLKYEIARMWRMKEVEVIPVVVGALGSVTKDFEKWIQKLDLGITAETLQKPCLLGTARIIRKVLDMK
ncbi:uncharacterized protein [Penaeus vannamei]|uniref:uncharacterized protein n=1 Tax=Penaeus vannamei TaxID=6689 RepID=UPI00387F685C